MKLAISSINKLKKATAKEMEAVLSNGRKNNCISIFGADVKAGEYVLYGDGEEEDALKLAQTLDIQDARDVDKKQLKESKIPCVKYKNIHTRVVPLREFITHSTMSKLPLDRTLPENFLVPRDTQEAIPTAKCRYVLEEEIKEVAFVFHLDDVKKGHCNIHGMDNAYAVRRCKNPSGRNQTIKSKSFTSFISDTCCAKRIWDFVASARDDSRKVLSSGGAWNGRTKSHSHVGANVELFKYVMRRLESYPMEDGEIIKFEHEGTRPSKMQNPDLSNEIKRVREDSVVLRAIDEPAIKRMRSAVGIVGVANPTPAPSLKAVDEGAEARVLLTNNTTVRLTTTRDDAHDEEDGRDVRPHSEVSSGAAVLGDDDFEDMEDIQQKADKQKKYFRCCFPGVDCRCSHSETGRTAVTFCYKFKKVKGNNAAVSDLIGCCANEDLNREDSPPLELAVTQPLQYNGTTHEVVFVNQLANIATIRCIEHGATLDIGIEEATALVNQYCE